jgi:hypothetical protein
LSSQQLGVLWLGIAEFRVIVQTPNILMESAVTQYHLVLLHVRDIYSVSQFAVGAVHVLQLLILVQMFVLKPMVLVLVAAVGQVLNTAPLLNIALAGVVMQVIAVQIIVVVVIGTIIIVV